MSVKAQPELSALDALLDKLDRTAEALGQKSGRAKGPLFSSATRKHERHRFRCDCAVRFYQPHSNLLTTIPARTRNLSKGGLSLLARRVFQLGEPLEAELLEAGQAPSYLAGDVRFCRYAGLGYYEIGVRMRHAGATPAFSHDPAAARRSLVWLDREKNTD